MSNHRTYITRTEAIEREVIAPIEAGDATADEFDIDAIADAVLGGYEMGFATQVDTDRFWEIVAAHAR